jgi:hypothetical protein
MEIKKTNGEPFSGTPIRQVGLTNIHLFGKEWGFAAFLSLGERLVLKPCLLLPDQVKAAQSFLG